MHVDKGGSKNVVYTRVLTCFTEKPSAIFDVHGLALLHRET